jgi:polyphenol oxidase
MVSRSGLAWLESPRLRRLPWLLHAFSTRRGGTSGPPCTGLNLGFVKWDQREAVQENRRRFQLQIGAQDFAAASVRQVHSSHSYIVTRDGTGQLVYQPGGIAAVDQSGKNPPGGDGLITAEAGILLAIRIADCLPVLLVDPRKRVLAAVHAGWRGALSRIIEKAVGDMRRVFGSDPQQLIAALGPSIRTCCYEVGEDVVEAFHGQFVGADRFFQMIPHRPETATGPQSIPFLSAFPPGHAPEHVPAARLDLIAVAQHQLASVGVKPSNVLVADYCTACQTELFFSYRKEGGCTGRQMAVIGIRPE